MMQQQLQCHCIFPLYQPSIIIVLFSLTTVAFLNCFSRFIFFYKFLNEVRIVYFQEFFFRNFELPSLNISCMLLRLVILLKISRIRQQKVISKIIMKTFLLQILSNISKFAALNNGIFKTLISYLEHQNYCFSQAPL